MDGFYAFMLLAVVVWFVLGMVSPVISLPPLLMRYLEPDILKPSRKIVFQWSCIFTVMIIILFCLTDFVLMQDEEPKKATIVVAPQANDIQRRIKSTELVDARLELMNLADEMKTSIDANKKSCRQLIEANQSQLQIMAHNIVKAEGMNTEGDPGVTPIIRTVRAQIVSLHNDLINAGCLE